MKTVNDIKKEISDIENTSQSEINEMKPATWRSAKKKLELLRLLVIYLETNPSDKFVNAEINRVGGIIKAKTNEFNKDELIAKGVVQKEITKLKNKHDAKYDLKKMRTHLRSLKLLID